MKKYAEQIGGQFTEYDHSQSIIIMPVSGGRYQTVLGTVIQNDLYNRKLISLHSKICSPNSDIDYRMLLEQTSFVNYCRFVVKENYLQVEAIEPLVGITEETIKEMVQEV